MQPQRAGRSRAVKWALGAGAVLASLLLFSLRAERFSSAVSTPPPPTLRAFSDHLYDIHFADAGKGWAVGEYGTILTTRDGGQTWVRQASGTTELLRAVDFVDGEHGWAVGVHGTILHTEDGGERWQPQEVDHAPLKEAVLEAYLRDVDFVDARHGWIVAGTKAVYHTADGGEHWQQVSFGSKDARLNRVRFFNGDRGWSVGEFGSLYVTRDGGRNWEPKPSGVQTTLMDVAFVDEKVGFVVGLQGTLLRTTDGGESWQSVPTGTTANLFGLTLARDKGVLVGDHVVRAFHVAPAGEIDWQEVSLPPQADPLVHWFYAACLVDGKTWVVGKQGLLLSVAGN